MDARSEKEADRAAGRSGPGRIGRAIGVGIAALAVWLALDTWLSLRAIESVRAAEEATLSIYTSVEPGARSSDEHGRLLALRAVSYAANRLSPGDTVTPATVLSAHIRISGDDSTDEERLGRSLAALLEAGFVRLDDTIGYSVSHSGQAALLSRNLAP